MKYLFLFVSLLAVMIGGSSASSASSVSLSADSLAVRGCSYNGPIGDGVIALYCNGDIHGSIVFPASGNSTYQISIVARGDLVSGVSSPNAQISIDRRVVGNISVTTSSFSTFTLDNVATSAGTHTLKIAFTNDYYSMSQDVNLYVQSITITPNESTTPPPSNPPTSADAYQQQLLNLINGSRASGGLPPLTFSAAQSSGSASCVGSYGHSVHMQQVGQISHDQFPGDICIPWTAAGENVGEASGSESSAIQIIHSLMMNEGPSGGHYQNIMSTGFTTVGIGLYYVNNTLWLTEDFVK
jgi:uncharacterized protein YkwD